MSEFKIIIGADIVPTQSNEIYFVRNEIDSIIDKKISEVLYSADYIIANLEAPICNCNYKVIKNGPALKINPDCILGLKSINPYFYTLSNNHILDYGKDGIKETLQILRENGIMYAGCGMNANEARKPFILDTVAGKIGIICCCENEFSIATSNESGANPFDLYNTIQDIIKLKKELDYVIVLYHGGKEHYRYPSPYIKRIFHIMGDCGADFVIAQHTHCVGCYEKYGEAYLIYGQGNFIFDNVDDEYWNSGILIDLLLDNEKKSKVNFIPIVKRNHKIYMADEEQRKQILKDFYDRSIEAESDKIIDEKYKERAIQSLRYYECSLGGKLTSNFIFRGLNKLMDGKISKFIYDKKNCVKLMNFIECEAHRELLIEGLKNRIYE